MSAMRASLALVLSLTLLPGSAHAVFFFFPLPNLAKPAPLKTIIEALEKSEETKAVAYASEDKTFGSKYWVWGHFAGHVPQAEADRVAMSRCEAALLNAKRQKVGDKELYDFGEKRCELYEFANKSVSPRANEWQPPAPPGAAAAAAVAASAPVAPVAPPVEPSTPLAAPLPTPTPAVIAPAAVQAASQASEASAAMPARPVASQPEASPSKPAPPESSTARRLRELNDLLRQKLITQREYEEKRKAILSSM